MAVCAIASMSKTPGHDRSLRKVALEERLVNGDVFQSARRLAFNHLIDAIDHQKRISVRQQLHNAGDVSRFRDWVVQMSRSLIGHLNRLYPLFDSVVLPWRRERFVRRRMMATSRRQSAMGTAGIPP